MSAIIKNIKENWLIASILLFGIVLRFVPIDQYEFSHDELSGISRTIYPDFISELNYGVKLDAHPALIQMFLWFWVKLVGFNEILIKLPFLLCGILAIWYIFKFSKTYFDIKTGWIASTIVSLSFIFLVYSSYARMYIPGVLFSVLLLQSVFKLLFFEIVNKTDYIKLVVCVLLSAYNHHMSCLFAAVTVCLGLFYLVKERRKNYLMACAAAVILYLPHLSITLYQLSIGGIGFSVGGWLSAPRINEVYFFIKTLLGTGTIGKVNIAVFLMLFLISVFKLIPITKKQFLLWWIFIINYLIIHLYSVFRNPILQYSVLLFSGIALIVFMSSFASFLTKKQTVLFVLFIAIGFNFQTIKKKHYLTKVNVHEFEEQAKIAVNLQKRYGSKNVACIFNCEKFFVLLYEKKFNTRFQALTAQDTSLFKTALLRHYLKNLKTPYLVVTGFGPADLFLFKEFYPNLISHEENYFSNVTVLSKKYSANVDVSVLSTMNLLNSDLEMYVNWKRPMQLFGDSISYDIIKNEKEFPFNIKLPIRKANLLKNQFLVGEMLLKTDSSSVIGNDKLCLSVSLKGQKAVFYKAVNLKDYVDTTKRTQRIYIELFAGTDFPKWYKENMDIDFFLQKDTNSQFNIFGFNVHQTDYNPTKWTLWD